MSTDDRDEDIGPPPKQFRPSPLALPARALYVPRAGDGVQRIEPPTPDPGAAPFCVPAQRVPFGQLFFQEFIGTRNVTDEECLRLESILQVKLSDASRDRIDAAIHLFISMTALKPELATWKQFQSQLKRIIKATNAVADFLAPEEMWKQSTGVLSVRGSILAHLALSLPDCPNGLWDARQRMVELAKLCEPWLKKANRRTKKGTLDQLYFRFFQRQMFAVVRRNGVRDTLLPADFNKKYDPNDEVAPPPDKKTIFFRFVEELIKIAVSTGTVAIEKSSLTADKRSVCIAELQSYADKDELALNKQLRGVKRKVQTKLRPQRK